MGQGYVPDCSKALNAKYSSFSISSNWSTRKVEWIIMRAHQCSSQKRAFHGSGGQNPGLAARAALAVRFWHRSFFPVGIFREQALCLKSPVSQHCAIHALVSVVFSSTGSCRRFISLCVACCVLSCCSFVHDAYEIAHYVVLLTLKL